MALSEEDIDRAAEDKSFPNLCPHEGAYAKLEEVSFYIDRNPASMNSVTFLTQRA
jgi:hypothetical protein